MNTKIINRGVIRMSNIKITTNPVKVVRLHCIECSGGRYSEVTKCTVERCKLYPFRFGKNPYRKKQKTNPNRKGVFLKKIHADSAGIQIEVDSSKGDTIPIANN